MTPVPGIFASGDCVTGTKSVVEAIAAARACAEGIDRWLGGDGLPEACSDNKPEAGHYIGKLKGFADMPRIQQKIADACERLSGFDSYEECYTDGQAQAEAGRCLQCDLRLSISKAPTWQSCQGSVNIEGSVHNA